MSGMLSFPSVLSSMGIDLTKYKFKRYDNVKTINGQGFLIGFSSSYERITDISISIDGVGYITDETKRIACGIFVGCIESTSKAIIHTGAGTYAYKDFDSLEYPIFKNNLFPIMYTESISCNPTFDYICVLERI